MKSSMTDLHNIIAVLASGEEWFKGDVERWRSLGGPDINTEFNTESITFSITPGKNIDKFIELLAKVRCALQLKAIAEMEAENIAHD